MTVEEALVALLAGVAGILLFLGLAQALDSRRPRPLRRNRLVKDSRESGGGGSARRDSAWGPPPTLDGSSDRLLDLSGEPLAGGNPDPASAPFVPQPPPHASVPTEGATGRGPMTLEPMPGEALADACGSGDPDSALVEACATLYLTGKHAELRVAAGSRLHRGRDNESAGAPPAITALWSLTALSRQALGDDAEARAAFAAALAVLPHSVVEGCPPRLAAVSVPIARRLIEVAEQSPEGAEDRIVAPRLAAFWLRWGLAAAPEDHGVQALLGAAHEALSEGYADVIAGLIRRHEWSAANRVLQEGRDAGELPAARGGVLVEVLAASFRQEVERLTAPAIRGAKDESRAVAALESAETMLASMIGAEFPSRQWGAMIRRIWRSYAHLGLRRLRSGGLDEAADALFQALGMKEIDRRRQGQVREAIVRTLEALAEQKVETIAKLLAEGDRPAAAAEVQRLMSQLQRAREGGVSQEELMAASTTARRLAQQLEPPPGG